MKLFLCVLRCLSLIHLDVAIVAAAAATIARNKQIRFTYRIPFSLYGGSEFVVHSLTLSLTRSIRTAFFSFFAFKNFPLILSHYSLSRSCVEYVP